MKENIKNFSAIYSFILEHNLTISGIMCMTFAVYVELRIVDSSIDL